MQLVADRFDEHAVVGEQQRGGGLACAFGAEGEHGLAAVDGGGGVQERPPVAQQIGADHLPRDPGRCQCQWLGAAAGQSEALGSRLRVVGESFLR
ncbi:hypothetical protein ABZY93_31860 [Streptomyces smyrnaeus]|uniref:hypothetical protein n=1 Tax=Streptomyces smyrnaeus TaxID=1387713 RepID=UPI00339FA584